MTGKMQYLIGPAEWGASGRNGTSSPNPPSPAATSSSTRPSIYGIAADGKCATLYPANFNPGEIVHDVPLRASS